MKSFQTTVQVDENGDFFIVFPEEFLEANGLKVGDEFYSSVLDDSILLSKKVDAEPPAV